MNILRYFGIAAALFFLTAGWLNAAIIRVPTDEVTIQAAVEIAENGDTVLVEDGTYTGTGNRAVSFGGKEILLISDNGPGACIIDCEGESTGFICDSNENENTEIIGFTIINAAAQFNGGAINCFESSPTISNCIIHNNSAVYSGGGAYFHKSSSVMTNCQITNNFAMDGGGIYCSECSPTIQSCTIADNSANSGNGGGISFYLSSPVLTDVIVWENTPQNLKLEDSDPQITYSDIQGGYAGAGNIDGNPRFVEGAFGDYYLSQTASGQDEDSPCADAGSGNAAGICFTAGDVTICLDDLSTRTDGGVDTGVVDMGFHYEPDTAPTHTPEYTYTPTPENSATPAPNPLGVKLDLSENSFQPGDLFLLSATLSNPGPAIYADQPFVVLLDAYGIYFWHPDWTQDFSYEPVFLGIDSYQMEILRFQWPDEPSAGSGILFYSALLEKNLSQILGAWDSVSFGWSSD